MKRGDSGERQRVDKEKVRKRRESKEERGERRESGETKKVEEKKREII